MRNSATMRRARDPSRLMGVSPDDTSVRARSFRGAAGQAEIGAGPALVDDGPEEEHIALAVWVEAGRRQLESVLSGLELRAEDRPGPLAPPRDLAAIHQDAGSAPLEAPPPEHPQAGAVDLGAKAPAPALG